MADRLTGTVLKIEGTASLVDTGEQGVLRCDLRARLFRQLGVRLAVGDRVEVRVLEPAAPADPASGARPAGHGMIEAVLPRRTRLRRPRAFKRDQVLCANVDQVVLVVSVLEPEYKRNFIDRVLVATEREQLAAVVVFNKIDLADRRYRRVVEDDARVYERIGYGALLASAATGENMDALAKALRDRISVVTGPSGVGKTTLLNFLAPGVQLRTAEVSESTGRGRHTTSAAELVSLPGGGYVVDTPGVRAFGLWDVGPRELATCFPELREASQGCRFGDCSHRSEPECAVLDSLKREDGRVDEERYDSYLKLRDDLEAEEAARQAARKR